MQKEMRVDIVGFGPIGRELARNLAERRVRDKNGQRYVIASISDSSATICPRDSREVVSAVRWKEARRRKLSDWNLKKNRPLDYADSGEAIKDSDASVVVDVTNSDYGRVEEARRRALDSLARGKHFVTANKVALSNHFREIFGRAEKNGLRVGFGATICGARHAVSVARNLPATELESASAVLNASTTFIYSKLQEDPSLSLDEAARLAADQGTLESDWNIDLDAIDAAAKTAILANVLFTKSGISFPNVGRSGLREKTAQALLQKNRRGGAHSRTKVRLVSEITAKKAEVKPTSLPASSPLAVEGRFNATSLRTRTLGEITVKNLGGGVALTSSVIISDLMSL